MVRISLYRKSPFYPLPGTFLPPFYPTGHGFTLYLKYNFTHFLAPSPNFTQQAADLHRKYSIFLTQQTMSQAMKHDAPFSAVVNLSYTPLLVVARLGSTSFVVARLFKAGDEHMPLPQVTPYL